MQDAEAELNQDFYTIEQLADVLKVSTDTIRRRIRAKKLYAVKRTDENIPGHQERWYIPKEALGVQEVTEVIQIPRTLSVSDFEEAMTARLNAVLNERDQQIVELVKNELNTTIERILDDQLRSTNRRIEGLDRSIRALPAPATSETITELQAQVDDLRADLAGIKECIGNVESSTQATAETIKMLLPTPEKQEPEKEVKLTRWQHFKNRFSR